MSKRPSQRDDNEGWDNESSAPRAGHPSHELPLAPKHEAETALYYFNIQTGSSVIEDPEGVTHPDLQAAREAALATARTMTAEGDQKGEERRGWHFEIMNRAHQPVLTVAFPEALDSTAPG
jgi:hypothetical protein